MLPVSLMFGSLFELLALCVHVGANICRGQELERGHVGADINGKSRSRTYGTIWTLREEMLWWKGLMGVAVGDGKQVAICS